MDIDIASVIAEGDREAEEAYHRTDVGGYPTLPTYTKVVGIARLKNRLAFDIVSPCLVLKDDNVIVGEQVLFHMSEPLISQMIFLKSHLCPENLNFFIEWLARIAQLTKTADGHDSLFKGSDNAELWFLQDLPSIAMANPTAGIVGTIRNFTKPQ